MIKRYNITSYDLIDFEESPEGEWVKWEDYDRLDKTYIELNSMFRAAITDRDYWMKQVRKEGILY